MSAKFETRLIRVIADEVLHLMDIHDDVLLREVVVHICVCTASRGELSGLTTKAPFQLVRGKVPYKASENVKRGAKTGLSWTGCCRQKTGEEVGNELRNDLPARASRPVSMAAGLAGMASTTPTTIDTSAVLIRTRMVRSKSF